EMVEPVPGGVLAPTIYVTAVVGAPHAAVWQTTSRPVDAWGYVLIVLATVPLAGRRRWPLPVLGVTVATLAVFTIAGYPYGPVMFALVVAAYTAGARLPVRRHVLDKRPDQVRAALEAINRTSRDALAELRATLAVLRSAGPAPGSAEADARPAHGRLADGLERLDRLVARMAASGLRVDVTVDG